MTSPGPHEHPRQPAGVEDLFTALEDLRRRPGAWEFVERNIVAIERECNPHCMIPPSQPRRPACDNGTHLQFFQANQLTLET